MEKLYELTRLGQSVWLDYIRRSFTRCGALREVIHQGVRGVTSNPSIFEQAIDGGTDYDLQIKTLAAQGKSTLEIYETLAIEDIQEAADLFLPLYEEFGGVDGRVSLEVNPRLANDTAGTVQEAVRLYKAVARPNILIKIPATPEGIPAIEEVISRGISVNVTLIFSIAQYEAAAQAYLSGLEKLVEKGRSPESVVSVASVFISRVDTAVDALLKEFPEESDMRGHIAVDNARLIYSRFLELFAGERWNRLAQCGAHVQRPLWASTGTKNPNYPDTLYIDSLIGPNTVNTAPPNTIKAFGEHGIVDLSAGKDLGGARRRIEHLVELGIDLPSVTQKLLEEGVSSFNAAFSKLLEGIERKSKRE